MSCECPQLVRQIVGLLISESSCFSLRPPAKSPRQRRTAPASFPIAENRAFVRCFSRCGTRLPAAKDTSCLSHEGLGCVCRSSYHLAARTQNASGTSQLRTFVPRRPCAAVTAVFVSLPTESHSVSARTFGEHYHSLASRTVWQVLF